MTAELSPLSGDRMTLKAQGPNGRSDLSVCVQLNGPEIVSEVLR